MKRKFLVITSNRSVSVKWSDREAALQRLFEKIEAGLDDYEVAYTTYGKITCTVRDGQVEIRDSKHDIDLRSAGLVHFKNWTFDSELASTIADYFDHHNVRFFNSEVNAKLAWGKISQMCRLALNHLPVPDTYYATRPSLLECFANDKLPASFNYPLILKADAGAKGNDNHLIKTANEAIEVLHAAEEQKEFVIQNYLPNDGDYRFLFMGLESDPLVFHRQNAKGSHLSNTSRGGKGTLVSLQDLPDEYLTIARNAAKIFSREICGVDIIVDKKTGKPYVLEVNSTPAIATGFALDEKASKFVEFLKQQLGAVDGAPKITRLGRADTISFLDGSVDNLPAKIDTGAYRSSVWATDIEEKGGTLFFTLLGPESPFYSGKRLQTEEYRKVQVENSFGHKQERYSVFLRVKIGGRNIRSNFTLANRGSKTYSALIGRKMLKNRFVVDVSTGKSLNDEEVNGDNSLE